MAAANQSCQLPSFVSLSANRPVLTVGQSLAPSPVVLAVLSACELRTVYVLAIENGTSGVAIRTFTVPCVRVEVRLQSDIGSK